MIVVLDHFSTRRIRRLTARLLGALALGWVLGVITVGYYVILCR